MQMPSTVAMHRLFKAFLYSCLLAICTLFSTSLLWQKPFQLTLVLASISAFMLLVWKSKEDLYLYAIVAVSGAIAEAVAIAFGVWKYTLPNFAGIPAWLPLLWGLAAVFIRRIAFEIHHFLRN
jgi:hypothetical protein